MSKFKGGIGQPVRRNEDNKFLYGRGQYLGDLYFPRLKEVAFVRSPVAHAEIVAIDIPEKDSKSVFVASDLGNVKPIVAKSTDKNYKVSEQNPLATGKVRFVGEALAICVANSRAEAEDIAQRVEVDFEELTPITTMDMALGNTCIKVHEEWADNIYLESNIHVGDIERIRKEAHVVIREDFRLNRHGSIPMEGRGVLAFYDYSKDELVVYTSTQFPHVIRTVLAESLNLPERKLRVIAPDVGGGFGVKSNFHPEELAVAALALKVDYPVRWVEDRREHLLASQHAREHEYKVIAYADTEGAILGIEAEIRVDAGAYAVWPWTAGMEGGMAAGILTGPYDIPVYHARVLTIATNKSPLGPYRGVGRTGACFAIERTIDELAKAVGKEPYSIRIKNMVASDKMPFKNVTNKVFDSGDYAQSVRIAKDLINLKHIRERQELDLRGENYKVLGVGFASYTEQTAHGTTEWVDRGMEVLFGYEQAVARFTPDGDLILEVGIQNHGQGLETTLAQVAAEVLAVDPRQVVVRHGDTGISPYGMGTVASRSMVMAGGAVAQACKLLKEKIKRIGAHLLEVDINEVRLFDGAIVSGDKSIGYDELAYVANIRTERLPEFEKPGLEVVAVYEPERATGAFSYGTHAVTLEIDLDACEVKLLDYVVVHDCGTVVNPMIVEGQLIGGVVQGIGTALYEEIPYYDYGQPLLSTFMYYLIPGAPEISGILISYMNTQSPHTEFSMKGMGDGGAIAPPAAILNAISDALAFMQVTVNETPVTPRRLFEILDAAGSEEESSLLNSEE